MPGCCSWPTPAPTPASTTSARTASCTSCARRRTACSCCSRPAAWPPPTRCSPASTATSGTTGDHESLATVEHLFEAALYLGRLSREVAGSHRAALDAVGADGTATFILGGQIAGERPDILLVYPEGNYIRTSDTVPFLQIGERKYGKFLLELAVRAHVDLQTRRPRSPSARCSARPTPTCRSARPTTWRSTATARSRSSELRIEEDHPYLAELDRVWTRQLLDGVANLPPIPSDVLSQLA